MNKTELDANRTTNADFVLLSDDCRDHDDDLDDDNNGGYDPNEFESGMVHSSLPTATAAVAEHFRQRNNPLNYYMSNDYNNCQEMNQRQRSPSITNQKEILHASKCEPIEDNLKNHIIEQQQQSRIKIFLAVFVVLICLSVVYHNVIGLTYHNCNEIITTIENRYPNQNVRLWASLKIGIEHVINYDSSKKNSPAIFLLAYNDRETFENMLKEIVMGFAICLNTNEKPLELTATDFSSLEMQQDYGIAIDKYRGPLEKSGILVVTDIDKVPFAVAEAFHSICDSEQPLVDRAVIFLTHSLKSSSTTGTTTNNLQTSMNVERYVTDNLRNVWQEIEKNKLEALITRVTDQILLVK